MSYINIVKEITDAQFDPFSTYVQDGRHYTLTKSNPFPEIISLPDSFSVLKASSAAMARLLRRFAGKRCHL